MKWWAVVAVCCVLAGCSGSSEPAAAPKPTTSTPSTPAPAASPAVAEPSGEPAPEALSAFRCAPEGKKDTWVAEGFLSNSAKKPATYQVTVYVGPIDGTSREVRTQQVASVAPDGSVRFEITKIPADGDACHVQVLRTGP